MALKTFTLLLAAAGLGTALYRMSQRGAPRTAALPQADPAPRLGEQLRDMDLQGPAPSPASQDHEDLLSP